MTDLRDRIELALGILALAGIVLGWLKVIRPRWHKGTERVTAALDTIAGRPPVIDSITGKELAPELPSIGKRMDAMEGSVSRLVGVIEGQHKQDQRLDDHERRIHQLEEQVIERVASKAEAISAFRAIEAVAKQADPIAPEIEEES